VPKEAPNDDRVKVERVGGLAGFSLPGSRIKSAGECLLSKLSSAELRVLDALFQAKSAVAPPKPDGFVYRLTRTIDNVAKTIEVAEEHVPMAIRRCVKDTLA
jgi:hypothetical protein